MQATRKAVLAAIDDGPVTGPTIAEQLEISRAAVWNHVEALREAGFGIESTDSGYVLDSCPEYGAAAIEYGLDAPFDVVYHDSVSSTNERGRERATAGERDVVVVADAQTGGRGRLDREWASPPGGVWLSLVIDPDCPPAEAPVYTLAAAVAVVEALSPLDIDVSIKWPNDVLVDTDNGPRKVAGILTELAGERDRVEWLVLGVGCNANVDADALPERATSLSALVGEVDRRALAHRLLESLDELRGRPAAVVDAWREHARTLGRRVRVDRTDATVKGVATDIERPGALVIETDDGDAVRVTTGDCEHLRPTE